MLATYTANSKVFVVILYDLKFYTLEFAVYMACVALLKQYMVSALSSSQNYKYNEITATFDVNFICIVISHFK